MSTQRPAWFRLTSLAMRPPIPAPAQPPPPPPSSAPVLFPPRPTIPIRAPQPPSQAQEPRPTPLPPSPPLPARAPLITPAPRNPTPNTSPVPTPVAAPPRPNPVATRATTSQNSPIPNLTALQPAVTAAPRSPAVLPPVIAAAPPQSPAARPAPNPSPLRFSPQIGAPAPKLPTPSNSPRHSSSTTDSTYSRQSTPKMKSLSTSSSSSPKQPSPVAAPIPSPKTIKPNSENNSPALSSSSSSSHSPKNKPLSRPPSPLTLPPAQLKSDGEVDSEPRIEQKNVLLVQEPLGNKTMKPTYNPHNHSPVSSKGKKKEPVAPNNYHKVTTKKPLEELGMSVITLAGENKGAVMELSTASQKKSNGRKVGSLGNGHESGSESGMEGKSKSKAKNDEASSRQPMTGFFNSNVQGVNNSILYHTNCRHNDPGIHLSLTRKPNGDRDHHG